MTRKTWVYIALVGLVTLGVIVLGIVKFVGSKDADELADDGETVTVEEEKDDEDGEKVNEYEQDEDKDKKGETSERTEEEDENVKLLEEKLELTEGTLVSKEELERQIEEWIEDEEVYDEYDYNQIVDRILRDYGSIVVSGYDSGKLPSAEMSESDINQLAISYPRDDNDVNIVYKESYPLEEIREFTFGDVEIEGGTVYGGDILNEENLDAPHLLSEKDGFKNIDGVDVGYFTLEYYARDSGNIGSYAMDDLDKDEIGEMLGLNVVYMMKLDKDMTQEEVKENIGKIEINGNTGEKVFEIFTDGLSYKYLKDSMVRVRVPVDMKDVYGVEDDLVNGTEWQLGNLEDPKVKVNGDKIKFKEITEDEYEEGIKLDN